MFIADGDLCLSRLRCRTELGECEILRLTLMVIAILIPVLLCKNFDKSVSGEDHNINVQD